METDPLFLHYLEDIENPVKDDYRLWLMLLNNVVEEDEVVDVDLENIIITYKRICEHKGITYTFNYAIAFDGLGYNRYIHIDSIKRVYPKEITKIIYVEEMP